MEKNSMIKNSTDIFLTALRKEVFLNAEKMKGRDVVKALFEITDEMWKGGIDNAWESSNVRDNWQIFDITWLTMLATRLKKYQDEKN